MNDNNELIAILQVDLGVYATHSYNAKIVGKEKEIERVTVEFSNILVRKITVSQFMFITSVEAYKYVKMKKGEWTNLSAKEKMYLFFAYEFEKPIKIEFLND
jgi:hypothetical protein